MLCLYVAGELLEAMADGIDRSSVVLVCFSQEYTDSHHCKTGQLLYSIYCLHHHGK